MSAPVKNQYAVKSPSGAADSHLHIRVTRADKARWVRAACGCKLSEWVICSLNKEAEMPAKKKKSNTVLDVEVSSKQEVRR